jgi:DNA-binding MarR family transcriptional regulator
MDLPRLVSALAVFGGIDPGAMPLHHIQILALIALRGNATYADIERELGLSNAAVSRSLNTLSSSVRHRSECFGLVEIYRDPSEGRRYRARLSKKGLALFRTIESL